MAIPLKRQMIQIDSLRFPANIPTGETLMVMYAQGGQAMKKAAALGIAGLLGECSSPGCATAWAGFPSQIAPPGGCTASSLGKLTLSMEPSLIFVSIGALFGMKVGLSMLLGLVVNYGVLAPRLIEDKIIEHDPPKLLAVAAPKLPLAVKAGQTFAVKLDEAAGGPGVAHDGRTEGRSSPVRRCEHAACSATPGRGPRSIPTPPAWQHDLTAENSRTDRSIRCMASSRSAMSRARSQSRTRQGTGRQNARYRGARPPPHGRPGFPCRPTSRRGFCESLGFELGTAPLRRRRERPRSSGAVTAASQGRAKRRRLPQDRRVVPLAGGDRAGGRRALGAWPSWRTLGRPSPASSAASAAGPDPKGPFGSHRNPHDLVRPGVPASPARLAVIADMYLRDQTLDGRESPCC